MECLDDFAVVKTNNAVVFHGSNLDVLPFMADNSVDSIVTDPPYELGFMGKKWDSSGIAYSVELWRECLRVLKPGGHLLAFGGSRTWHRIAVAIEDAGFDVRDSIAWMYGSGFPKSLDVAKAIDKGQGENSNRQLKFTAWMRSTGITARRIDEITNTKMGSHYTTHPTQPAIATADLFDKLRPYLPEVPEEIERLVAERTGIEWTAYKNREVIGQKTFTRNTQSWEASGGMLAAGEKKVKETLPATEEAKQWQGWGTALKPAFEPVVVARKPLVGTVAQNVLEWGVGGLNIDASRIGTGTGEKKTVEYPDIRGGNYGQDGEAYAERATVTREVVDQGRWPANVILDEFTAGLLDEQSGIRPGGTFPAKRGQAVNTSFASGQETIGGQRSMGDSGGASRFFYVAKASKRDRNEGLEELPEVRHSDRQKDDGAGGDNPRNRTNQAKQNFHPTVKPTDLMRYLIKLVTPAGGVVLDPFTGSGSTGKAALLDGYQFLGIELTDDYLPIIEGRLLWAEAEAERITQTAVEEENVRLF